ncbi:MAG: dihydropteroate synthase [Bacteroidaceae bacterium]|nr:dihydropteroate synthase [Bacteroidaceae bacterium]
MEGLNPYTINVSGSLIDLAEPHIMGILNITPDSFYSDSRKQTEESIRLQVRKIVDEGGQMIDLGAYSSRPGANDVPVQEEMERLRRGMKVLREEAPDMPVSIDTFRADVAKMCVEELGAGIINDISGGELDNNMFPTIAKLGVPYVLMHMKGTPQNMQQEAHYEDLMKEIMLYFVEKVQRLRDLGQKDIILDPGYGFAKTINHNYELLQHQEMLKIFELPILVGLSRKSMVYKLLGTTPDQALNGTSVLHTLALQKGANILRVHDVKACAEVIKIVQKTLHFNL